MVGGNIAGPRAYSDAIALKLARRVCAGIALGFVLIAIAIGATCALALLQGRGVWSEAALVSVADSQRFGDAYCSTVQSPITACSGLRASAQWQCEDYPVAYVAGIEPRSKDGCVSRQASAVSSYRAWRVNLLRASTAYVHNTKKRIWNTASRRVVHARAPGYCASAGWEALADRSRCRRLNFPSARVARGDSARQDAQSTVLLLDSRRRSDAMRAGSAYWSRRFARNHTVWWQVTIRNHAACDIEPAGVI